MNGRAKPAAPPALRAAEFPAALAAPRRAHSAHFVIHHAKPGTTDLSTADAPGRGRSVDDSLVAGWVVPKRHARRAVTRNLIRRQLRAALGGQAAQLEHGLWLVRLRAGFDPMQFPSAASPALRRAVRAEIAGLLARATGAGSSR
jgi:ribonuclease P protein component